MPYTPKTWENKPSTASPINATNLNHMEGGIKTNDDNILGAQNAILTLQGEMLQAQGDITALETLVDSIFPVDTESGNPAVITDAFGGACKSLKLTLEPIQSGSGEKSPQNPYVISGRTESNISRIGKNLYWGSPSFDSYANISNWSKQSETYNGHDVYKNIGGWNGLNRTIFLKAGTYTFSCMVKGSQANTPLYIFNASNTILLSTTVGTSWQKVSAVLNQGTDSNVTLRVETSGATPSLYVAEYQLEEGSTATPYEPYNAQTITRTYGTTIYGGTDEVTGDGAASKYEYAEYDGSNDENWNYGASTGLNQFYIQNTGIKYSTLNIACNRLKTIALQDRVNNYNTIYAGTNVDSININMETITSVEAWRSWLSSNPLQVAYEVATPTSIPLTAQNITLLHGDNVLTTDADSIEASYSADIGLYIDKKIAEGSQNNRSLSKGGSGDEELKEEEKEEEKKEEIEMKEAEPLTKEVR